MGANKIILNNEVLLDLEGDTVTEADVKSGVTFHKADGSPAVGTNTGGDGPVVTPTTEEKTVTPTKSAQVVEPTDADYLSKVTVNAIPDEYIVPSGTLIATSNNTYDVTDKVSVVVSLSEFDGTITIVGNK